MASKYSLLRAGILSLVFFGAACTTQRADEKSATYIAVMGNETDRLRLTVTRNSLVLTCYFEVSIRQPDGTVNARRVAITGDVATDGVPATVVIPSSVVGVPDQTFACFFDDSLNLHLSGDPRIRYPHLMYLVRSTK